MSNSVSSLIKRLFKAAKKFCKHILYEIFRVYKLYELKNHIVKGKRNRLFLGNNVSTANTLFNTSSGDIHVGDNTIFGHNCMVLTGRHEFVNGQRKKIALGSAESPNEGFDIYIGKGCWVASGTIIIGGVTIADNVIVGAGSVVTRDIKTNSVLAVGTPARIIKSLADSKDY